MDGFSAATGAVQAAPTVVAATHRTIKKMRLHGTFQVEWLQLGDGKHAFDAEDLADIEDFLNHQDTRPLLSLLAITLLAPEMRERSDSLEVIRETFKNYVTRWKIERSIKWAKSADDIWDAVVSIYDAALPVVGSEIGRAADEFSEFIQTPLTGGSGTKSSAVRYLERLRELASDLGRVSEAIRVSDILRESLVDTPTPPIITYTDTSKPATFSDLYVARTLNDESDGKVVASSELGGQSGPYRVVVQGPPGAGKSTFVKHLVKELAQDSETGQPALLLVIRQYFNAAQDQPVLEYLHNSIRTGLNVDIALAALQDALTLGMIVVIFDGLDEINDINQRAEMGQRIVSFGREYPAASMLVTSRSLGYDRAPLPPQIFRTLVLKQYSPAQTSEYIDRWFRFVQRQDLVQDFVRESQTVPDLTASPLLLSLLCVLYRERGSIPRRRRDIYARCADLLFHKWDQHRHIGQPEELHSNGDRIMQEIARWVYTSQSAQAGLSESVIQKCIGNYLRDSVGVEEGEARRRAGDFLEFCAERAWLLAKLGTRHGERVFGFTHRTFFEYFAAEAFARQQSSPASLAEKLVAAHAKDATSVLPELLLQAYDDKVERGAAEVFKIICSEARNGELILRLMEGVPLPSRTRAIGFDQVLRIWNTSQSIEESSFAALLSLNQDARTHFISDYLAKDSPKDGIRRFLANWAFLDLSGRTHRYQATWSEVVREVSESYWGVRGRNDPYELMLWLWQSGRGEFPQGLRVDMYCPTRLGSCVGTLWLAIERLSWAPEKHNDADLKDAFLPVVDVARFHNRLVPYYVAQKFEATILDRLATTSLGGRGNEVPDGLARWAILYAVALVEEMGGMNSHIMEALVEAFGNDVEFLVMARALSLNYVESPPRESAEIISKRLKELPVWLSRWARGKSNFVNIYEAPGQGPIIRGKNKLAR